MKSILLSMLLAFSMISPLFAGSHGGANPIKVEDAYVRAVPPGSKASASFMKITNKDKVDHSLVVAESGVATNVELHTHIHKDGMMMMRQVKKIDLPAGKTVELKPGGLHVMLIGLTKQIKPGDQVNLTLIYENGKKTRLTAPVKKIGGGHMNHKHHH